MTMQNEDFPIVVIGCNGMEPAPDGRSALAAAEVVVAGPRLLALAPTHAETVAVDARIRERMPAIAETARRRRTVVLASGDPLYCGIGGTLARCCPPERLRFVPAPTAFQALFARLGQPWEGALLWSVHGVEGGLPWRRLLQAPLAAVYGDARRTARALAAELLAHFPEASARPAAAGCDLGLAGERVARGTLAEIAQDEAADASLSVLALLPWEGACPEIPLGLPDGGYEHYRNMITHPEVRAVALAKLRLRPGVMWDIGAGSGAVGIEAAGVCPGLVVHAVEKDAERCIQARANAAAAGAAVSVHEGDAMALVDTLPPPDRVFLGGGGPALLEACFARLRPGGVLVMTGVLLETIAAMQTALPEARQEFLQLAVSRAKALGGGEMLAAENPIALAVWVKG